MLVVVLGDGCILRVRFGVLDLARFFLGWGCVFVFYVVVGVVF